MTGVVRRLANSNKVDVAHHHVKLLHLAAHVGQELLGGVEPTRRVLAALMPVSVKLKSTMFPLPYGRGAPLLQRTDLALADAFSATEMRLTTG